MKITSNIPTNSEDNVETGPDHSHGVTDFFQGANTSQPPRLVDNGASDPPAYFDINSALLIFYVCFILAHRGVRQNDTAIYHRSLLPSAPS